MPVTVFVAAGTRRHKHDARLSGRLRVPFCGMRRALFVAGQDVFDVGDVVEGVVDPDGRAAGIAEDDFDVLLNQTPNEDLRSRHHAAVVIIIA